MHEARTDLTVPGLSAPNYSSDMPRTALVALYLALTACTNDAQRVREDGDSTPVSRADDCDTAFVAPGEHAAGYRVEQSGSLELKLCTRPRTRLTRSTTPW